MGYQQNENKKFNKNRPQQQSDRPRNKTITYPLVMSGTTKNDRTYDVNDALATLESLNDNGIFEVLSVPVQINRGLLENNHERRGNVNIGFIKSISISDLSADIVVFGPNVENIEKLNLQLTARVLVKNEQVSTFLGFDLVSAEEN